MIADGRYYTLISTIDPGRKIRDGAAVVAGPVCIDGLAEKALASDAIADVGLTATVGAVV